jgi:hypothetical protein
MKAKPNGKVTLTYSSMQAFLTCPKKYFWRYVEELEPVEKPEALLLGSAVHRWLEYFYSQVPADRNAFLNEVVSPKARGILQGIMENYGRIYSDDFDKFEVLSVERLLSGKIINPETSKASANFQFGGRLDTLVRLQAQVDLIPAGSLAIIETKTASRVDELFWNRMAMDPQVALYAHFLQDELGDEIAGIIYNVIQKPGLRQGKNESEDAFENRVREKMADPELYHRKTISVKDLNAEEVLSDLWNVKNFINLARENGAFPKSNSSCTMFNTACDYLPLCAAKDPELVIRESGIYTKREANVELVEADPAFKEQEQNVAVPF